MNAPKTSRRKRALELIEAQYAKFKAAGEDKHTWTTMRHGKPHVHKGSSYAQECKRFELEIANLKAKLSGQA